MNSSLSILNDTLLSAEFPFNLSTVRPVISAPFSSFPVSIELTPLVPPITKLLSFPKSFDSNINPCLLPVVLPAKSVYVTETLIPASSNCLFNLYSIIVCAYNLLCCCLILYISNKIVLTQKIKTELETTSRLLRQAEEQYKVSKENVNLINLKCHDLKHQIREYASKRNIDQEAIKDLESVINIYDSTIKTGNEALDLILTEKSLYCQKQNIKLTCLADCSRLIFMHDSDLYSLFGNMIDNAIEAVSKIDNAEKRNINLIVRNIKNYVSIAVENFYEER